MKTSDFDYTLPTERIAQEPAAIRDACKMLVMDRTTGALEDRIFRDIAEYLRPGDLLVANETRVMPARLLGEKRGTHGAAEVFLLREVFPQQVSSNAHAPSSTQVPSGAQTPISTQTPNGTQTPISTQTPNDTQALSNTQTPNGTQVPSSAQIPNNTQAYWEALVRPGKRLKPGAIVDFPNATGAIALSAEIVDWVQDAEKGERLISLSTGTYSSLDEAMHAAGNTPLPPYIKNYTGDKELYQTVFSTRERSAAAPTAGLHFTPELIEQLKQAGIAWETVELEVGLDTFRIVDEDDPRNHAIHTEFFTVPPRVIEAVHRTKEGGGRVVAVGTTSVRSLESAWNAEAGRLTPREREATSLYILPGYEFHAVDALITNFHVPRSTLMMLVSAFSTRENIMNAYAHAIEQEYRMLSFGDAMFICP